MFLRKSVFSAFCLFIFGSVFGQTQRFLPVLAPPSPEAASYAKYGNYQVNMFTGIPDISIPLYNIKVGELSVPISISYHSSGIRVNDIASRVGLGWDLNAGGSITRTIMGRPDELPNNYLSATPTSSNRVRLQSDINTALDADLTYLSNVNSGIYDVEPDIFSYNFPGHSGKFLFNQSNNFSTVLIPYAPVSVNWSTAPSNLYLGMTDENGTVYKFDSQESTSTGGGISTTCTSAWMLTDMISSNKQDDIHFNYVQRTGSGITDTYYSDFLVLDQYCTGSCATCNGVGTYNSDMGTVSTWWQQLNEIDFKNGKVVFESAPDNRLDFAQQYQLQHRLNSIKIYNYDAVSQTYSIIRSIQFFQSYFISGADQSTARLRLDSIQIKDANSVTVEKYKFDYNTSIALPANTSRMKDYWGYFNNVYCVDPNGNPTMIPRMQVAYYSSPLATPVNIWIGGNLPNGRDPDPNYMQADILQKITYPTGGFTQFEYETNQYLDDQNNQKYAGGLRIKSIKSYTDINAAPIVKTYKYGTNESGNGRNNFFLEDHFFISAQNYTEPNTINGAGQCSGPSGSNTKTTTTYFANPTVSLEGYDGAPVVYPTVTEYIGDGTNNNGKTIYTFQDMPDAKTDMIGFGKPIITSYHFERGMLTDRSDFKANADNTYTIVKENRKSYQFFPFQSTTGGIALGVFKKNIFDGYSGETIITAGGCDQGSDEYAYSFNNYEVVTGDNKLISESDIGYDQNDNTKSITTTTNYTYDDIQHVQLIQTQTTNSKGQLITDNLTYPYNYTTEPYATMTTNHIFSKVIQDTKTSNNPVANTLLTKQISNYTSFNGNNYLPSNIQFQVQTNPLETRANFNMYDTRGNILEMQKPGDVLESFQWGYGNLYVVAKAENAANNYHLVPSQTTSTATLNYPYNYFSTQTINFTADYAGAITITILNGAYLGGNTNATISGNFTLTGPSNQSGSLCNATQTSLCSYPNTLTFNNMPAGAYTFSFYAVVNSASSIIPIQISYQGTLYTPAGIKEFFYENFEENSGATAGLSHTGNYYWNGSYTVPFTPPNNRTYLIQWWNLLGSNWIFNQQQYTANMVLQGPVDDIRVFPSDAQIVTYTYTPLVGLTSQTDPNGKTSYFEYDAYQRLKNVKDYQGNIVKNFQYNYGNSCGPNCYVLPLQTFNGSNTISYPVGVFNVNGQLLGNASSQSQYISVWNSNSANQAIGTITAGTDSLHFNFTVAAGKNPPTALTGCRYYQLDIPFTRIDAVRSFNAAYIDFGDGTGFRIDGAPTTGLPANTSVNFFRPGGLAYYIHTYPDSSLKTITFYHNDATEIPVFDNFNNPASSLTLVRNFRGNFPQNMQSLGSSSFQQSSALSVANIMNWSTINSLLYFGAYCGDGGVSPSLNMSYAQDFMANNKQLKSIWTNYGPYNLGYIDSTFKLSRLKSDWNTYFTNLQTLNISDAHWNREDLSSLKQLNNVGIVAAPANGGNVSGSNPAVALPTAVIDNIINQIAAGAGQYISNGYLNINSMGTNRSSASDASVSLLKSKGWKIYVNGIQL